MPPADLRAALKRAGRKPAACVIGLTKDRQAVILLDRLKKPRKLLGEAKTQAKAAGLDLDLTSLRFGRVSVDGKDAGFTVNKAVAPAAQQAMKAPMRAAGHPRFTINANPAIEDEPDGPDDTDDADDAASTEGSPSNSSAPAPAAPPSSRPAAATSDAPPPPRPPVSSAVPPNVARGVAAALAADPSRRPEFAGLLAQVRAGMDAGDPGAAGRGVAALRQAVDGTPAQAGEGRAAEGRAASPAQPVPAPAAVPPPVPADATLAALARTWAQQGQASASKPRSAAQQGGPKAPASPASKSAASAPTPGDMDPAAPDGRTAWLPPGDGEDLATPVLSREPWAPPPAEVPMPPARPAPGLVGPPPGTRPPGTVPSLRPPGPPLRGAAQRGAALAVPRAAGLLGRAGRALRWVGLRGTGVAALFIPDKINERTTVDQDVAGHPDLDGQVVQAPGSRSGMVRITRAGEGGAPGQGLAELSMDPDGNLRGGWQGAVLGHVDLDAGTITLTPDGEAYLRRKAEEAGITLVPPAAATEPPGAGSQGAEDEPPRPGTPGLPQAPVPGQEPQPPAWLKEVEGIETRDDDERDFINGLAMGGMKRNDIINALNERRLGGTATPGGPPDGIARPPVSASPHSPPGPPYPGPDVTPMDRQERALVQGLLDGGKGEEDVRRALAEHRARVGLAEADKRRRESPDRNSGLPDELTTGSTRARNNIADADPKLQEALRVRPGTPAHQQVIWNDFVAHHLIPMEVVRDHADLFRAAARAGWNTDEAANVIALPKDEAAQSRMGDAMWRQRPVHNSGHPNWNGDVEKEIGSLLNRLRRNGIRAPFEDTDGQEIRRRLERLQQRLRRKLLNSNQPRLTQSTPETEAA